MRYHTLLPLVCSLLPLACASYGAQPPPAPAELAGAAMIAAYPGASRACVRFSADPEAAGSCLAAVREAFGEAVAAVDGAVDAELARLQEGSPRGQAGPEKEVPPNGTAGPTR